MRATGITSGGVREMRPEFSVQCCSSRCEKPCNYSRRRQAQTEPSGKASKPIADAPTNKSDLYAKSSRPDLAIFEVVALLSVCKMRETKNIVVHIQVRIPVPTSIQVACVRLKRFRRAQNLFHLRSCLRWRILTANCAVQPAKGPICVFCQHFKKLRV